MENQIFLNISAILSTFDIRAATDENGKPIIPKVEYVSNAITYVLMYRLVNFVLICFLVSIQISKTI